MNISILSNYNDIDKLAWSDFVQNHPEGNIFQTPEMFDLYQITPNSEPFVFVALLNNAVIIGVLLAIVHKEFRGLLGNLTSRSIIIGGPLVSDNNPEIAFALMKTYNNTIKSKAIYSQIRNIFDVSYLKNVFQKFNYVYEDHLDIHVDLKKSEEDIWKAINPKRRGKIRKAEREQIDVAEVCSEKERHVAYKILTEVYHRANLPLASEKLFDNSYKVFHSKGMLKIYGAYSESKLVGVRFVFFFKNIAYDWYAGSFSKYYSKSPNDILPWRIMQIAKLGGYSLFDFGGAGSPNKHYGVRDFKKSYGGVFVNYGRFQIIHRPVLYAIISFMFKVYQKIKTHEFLN
jgi:lipid II:glycine glycyltransferase (peptidoglycan interpeptide bridge formation enzyme)